MTHAKLHRSDAGLLLERDGAWYDLPRLTIDEIFIAGQSSPLLDGARPLTQCPEFQPLPPLQSQEVWAAGVTYFRSRTARMEEAETAGGATLYDRVYRAPRPELFFKAAAHRVIGPGGAVRIRRDSQWNVPEPELTLAISNRGKIFGYTIGNDMSSRDIEGENPLYLPQAKIYNGSAAIGPCLLLSDDPLPATTAIRLEIQRNDAPIFAGRTTIDQIARPLTELVEYLFREMSFPFGCLLMTGTGIVPPGDLTVQPRDVIRIAIDGIGELKNVVAS